MVIMDLAVEKKTNRMSIYVDKSMTNYCLCVSIFTFSCIVKLKLPIGALKLFANGCLELKKSNLIADVHAVCSKFNLFVKLSSS